MQPAFKISTSLCVCVCVCAASEVKNICPNETLMQTSVLSVSEGTAWLLLEDLCSAAPGLLTTVAGFTVAAGELLVGSEISKRHSVAGSSLQCFPRFL